MSYRQPTSLNKLSFNLLFRFAIVLPYLQKSLLMHYQMGGRIMHGVGSIKEYNCESTVKIESAIIVL